jgi:hypothetical protein
MRSAPGGWPTTRRLVIAGLQQLVRNRIGPAAGGMTGSGQVSG